MENSLREPFVEAQPARKGSRTRVRDTECFASQLHRSVLAVAAVQCDERDVGGSERLHQVLIDVELDYVVPNVAQCGCNVMAGAQGELALE
jgi:hypothetical protein